MNDALAEEIKQKGGGSSPHRGSENGGMPGKSDIWSVGLSHSHKQYLESIYWQESDSSNFPTTVAGLLFLILWDTLSSVSDWAESLVWD